MDRFIKKRKLDDAELTEQSPTVSSESTEPTVQKVYSIDSRRKIRRYSNNYVAMGFTWTGDPDCPSPLCIVCGEQLSNSAMVPAKLKRHFTTLHPDAAKQGAAYFERALNLNKKQASTFKKKFKTSEKAQEASYAVAEIVAKTMKCRNRNYQRAMRLLFVVCCSTPGKQYSGE